MRSSIYSFAVPFVLCLALCPLPEALAKTPLAQIGENKVKLEVAQTQAQIERGLMFRSSMPEDQGMVFLFHPPRKVRFWMFNCLMSLDMLFIKDGKIVKISHDVPPCKSHNREECPLYPEEGQIEASEVLELNAGYCQRHAVKEGDSISFSFPGVEKSSSSKKKSSEKAELGEPAK
ncbi:MAG: DUF192 domain-containing protein [Candidatus Obscuribacterales bacterium]|nr:DUF192 domain-containing protein [Candidatus Obscuribacterales bacterium]